MIFTCISDDKEQTYEGFNCLINTLEHPEVLALAMVEGDADCWKLDPENVQLGLEELQRYYRSEHGHEPIISVYRR